MDHVGPRNDGESSDNDDMPTGPNHSPSDMTTITSSPNDLKRALEEHAYYQQIDRNPKIPRKIRDKGFQKYFAIAEDWRQQTDHYHRAIDTREKINHALKAFLNKTPTDKRKNTELIKANKMEIKRMKDVLQELH